jgi:hypothetical protein
MHERFQSCIDACNLCATACDHCAAECIAEASREPVECIRLDLDCAATCRLVVEVMGRGGPTAEQICALCADVCEACAPALHPTNRSEQEHVHDRNSGRTSLIASTEVIAMPGVDWPLITPLGPPRGGRHDGQRMRYPNDPTARALARS